MKCISYILDLLRHKIQFANIIAGCEGTVINSTVGLICRRLGFTCGIYDHLSQEQATSKTDSKSDSLCLNSIVFSNDFALF